MKTLLHTKKKIWALLCMFIFVAEGAMAVVQILSPNGGESIAGGSTFKVEWVAGFPPGSTNNVTLRYSIDNGSNWILITTAAQYSDGNYMWHVPQTPSTQCLFRMEIGAWSDNSDATFTISGPAGISTNLITTGVEIKKLDNYFEIVPDKNVIISSINMYDITGRLVATEKIGLDNATVVEFYPGVLTRGIYFITVETNKGIMTRKCFF